MDEKQKIQSREYEFPYHYLPEILEDSFRQGRVWSFSLSYVVAFKLITQRLSKKVLSDHIDIGCGDGALIFHLRHKHPNIRFLGIDYDERSIKWARMFNRERADFRSVDITHESLEKEFNSASLIEVIEHIPPNLLPKFISSVRKLLVDDAVLIITVPHINKTLFDKHYQHFNFDSLRQTMEKHFIIEEMFGFEFNTKLERLIKRISFRQGSFFDSKFINKLRLNSQLNNISVNDGGSNAGRIFCVCRPK